MNWDVKNLKVWFWKLQKCHNIIMYNQHPSHWGLRCEKFEFKPNWAKALQSDTWRSHWDAAILYHFIRKLQMSKLCFISQATWEVNDMTNFTYREGQKKIRPFPGFSWKDFGDPPPHPPTPPLKNRQNSLILDFWSQHLKRVPVVKKVIFTPSQYQNNENSKFYTEMKRNRFRIVKISTELTIF